MIGVRSIFFRLRIFLRPVDAQFILFRSFCVLSNIDVDDADNVDFDGLLWPMIYIFQLTAKFCS